MIMMEPPPPEHLAALGAGQITDAVVAQAQSVLSSPQIQALKEIQQQQQAAVQLREQMQQHFEATSSKPSAEGPPAPRPPGS